MTSTAAEFPNSVAAAPPGTRAMRAGRLLAVLGVLLAIAIAAPRILTHTPYPRLGASLDWQTPDGVATVDNVVGPPARGRLVRGDRILAIDGRVLDQEARADLFMRRKIPRGTIALTVERGGRRLEIPLPPLELGVWQRLRHYTLPMAAVVAAPLVAFLLVWRRPDLPAAWAFLWFAALQGLNVVWILFRHPQVQATPAFTAYLDFYHALWFWFPASFLHFMTVFPHPRWPGRQPWRSPWFWMVVMMYVAPLALFALARATGRPIDDLFVPLQTVGMGLGLLALVDHYARRPRGARRPARGERVLALTVAVALAGATVFDWVSQNEQLLALISTPAVRLAYTLALFAWLGSPLVIAFLIANDPVFDPRRIVVRSLPYALLSGVLAALYLAIVLVSQQLFAAATGEETIVFNVVAALIVAFAVAPMQRRMQRALDRLYGRDPQALREALDQTGRELLGALDRAELRRSVERGLERGLKHRVTLEWPALGPPRLATGAELPEHARAGVENLLLQAGIRLENLALQEQRAASERQAVELREGATRAELRALQAQVQPHFLFNALNALSYLIETDLAAAQRFTERLADVLRYTVEANTRPGALLSEEIEFVEDYLGVARERYENPLSFEVRGDRELLSTVVPPLLLQPLVENSLKHGASPEREPLHLELETRAEGPWITLRFSDDGVLNGNGGRPGLGVGLRNLEQRMKSFAGPQASMTAGPTNGRGYTVTLRWPAPKEGASR